MIERIRVFLSPARFLLSRAKTRTIRGLPLVNDLNRGQRITDVVRLHKKPFAKSPFSSIQEGGKRRKHVILALASLSLLSLMVSSTTLSPRVIYAEANPPETEEKEDEKGSKFRLTEVRKHGQDAERVWVTKGNSVYDITDWVPGHPGGEVILRAAGGSIDQYWDIFSIHQKPYVYEILEEYRIGIIDPQDLVDGKVPAESIEDPFKNDPARDPRLKVHTDRPCNAETPASELSTFITPNEIFYVRNHLWVPETSEDTYTLTIDPGTGDDEKTYTLDDLRTKFPSRTITATLQCSGNRRAHMSEHAQPTNGLQWNVGAIGTASWTGPRLLDVLADAGLVPTDLPEDAHHVQFNGEEAYGASIPIAKALDPRGDVLLAYEMNGKPLPPDHGFPVRVLVPGHVAARSVKWVKKIVVSDEESTSQWQRRDYKCFGPNEGANPDWERARAIQELPVQSAITSIRDLKSKPSKDNERSAGKIAVEGYAFSGGGREIVRVDISVDAGRTWDQAELADESEQDKGAQHWSWKRWHYIVDKDKVGPEVLVKAIDEAYNTQPDTHGATYNHRGNLASAWHRVRWGGGEGGE